MFDLEGAGAEEELGLAGELAALSGAIAAVARARAEQGVGSALDAEVAEASSLRVVRARLEAERRWAVAKSALTLRFGLDASAPAVVRGDLEPLDGVGGSRGATHDPSRRPEVEALEAERRALELRAETFRRARVPNPSVSAFLHNDGFNERVFGVGVAVPLPLPAPLGRTYAGDIQETEAAARRALTEVDRLRRDLRFQMAEAQAAYEARDREVAAFSQDRKLRTRATLRELAEEIRAGRVAVRDTLLAQQALVETLQAHLSARRERALASVELARALGLPVEEVAR